MTVQKSFAYILIIGSIIGFLASFVLTIDVIKLIANPGVELPCNLNPFVSCTSVATSEQASVFGFPNSLLGITAFAMLFAIGVMLLSGGPTSQIFDGASRSKKPLWLLVNLGALSAMIFVMWFFSQSVYVIGSLCIYCMIVWAVTWPIFLYTTVWNFRENHFTFWPTFFNFISRHHLQILITWYLVIIFLILFQFKDFFFT